MDDALGSKTVEELIQDLYKIVRELESRFPKRRFSLDGHLVGSIGEVLGAERYSLDLLTASTPGHDATSEENTRVQLKLTQRDKVGLRSQPEHLIVMKLGESGTIEEIYNGPGTEPWKQSGRRQSNGQCFIGLSRLRALMKEVPPENRL